MFLVQLSWGSKETFSINCTRKISWSAGSDPTCSSFLPASCQTSVQGFSGDAVLLPCVYRGGDLPQKVSAFWRDKNDNNVLDIKQNRPDASAQNPRFRGRVEPFPDLFHKGNFSIVLKELQQADSGVYDCDVLEVDFKQTVSVSVSGESQGPGVSLVCPRPPPSAPCVTPVVLQRIPR